MGAHHSLKHGVKHQLIDRVLQHDTIHLAQEHDWLNWGILAEENAVIVQLSSFFTCTIERRFLRLISIEECQGIYH
jgi:hypothetical protein